MTRHSLPALPLLRGDQAKSFLTVDKMLNFFFARRALGPETTSEYYPVVQITNDFYYCHRIFWLVTIYYYQADVMIPASGYRLSMLNSRDPRAIIDCIASSIIRPV